MAAELAVEPVETRCRAPMTPVAYRVAGRRAETDDVATLDLEPSGAAAIDAPAPGQFSMLYAFGVGEVPISVSGCPADDGVLRHTVRANGAVSKAVHDLAPGAPIGVRGPFGTPWPIDAAVGHDVVVIGGGIGLAPLRPVLQRLVTERGRFGRVGVTVGARTPSDLIFQPELIAWRGRFDLDVAVTVDAAPQGWYGDVGVVTRVMSRLQFEPDRTVAFVCGPEVMIRVVAHRLLAMGVDAERLFVSLERNMKCAIGQCGHCQIGPLFVCQGGPVVPWSTAAPLLEVPRR